MAKRKSLSKAIRFEVFKRDSFTCQYCGRSAPDVVLEIDHIVPVSKGGKDDIVNLVTACRDCNRGKRDKNLDDNTTLAKQKAQLDELNERREQMEMMVQWKESLLNLLDEQAEAINRYLNNMTKWQLNDEGVKRVKALIRRFGFQEVYTSVEIAYDRYYRGTAQSWANAFDKVGGICYNRKKAREESGI